MFSVEMDLIQFSINCGSFITDLKPAVWFP